GLIQVRLFPATAAALSQAQDNDTRSHHGNHLSADTS
ncbi:MAG: hypothetical protein ACI9P7_001789, partial [Candidatus Azotimanducaceae bacterium]